MKQYRWAQSEYVSATGIHITPAWGWKLDLYVSSPIWISKRSAGINISPRVDINIFRGPAKGRWGFFLTLDVLFATICLSWAKRMPDDRDNHIDMSR
jgi:hypothetical protein